MGVSARLPLLFRTRRKVPPSEHTATDNKIEGPSSKLDVHQAAFFFEINVFKLQTA
jgi:hypothetical protein